jgi:hypothetical protein
VAEPWTCIRCGPVELEEIYLLTWDSPHNEETHLGCGGSVDPPAEPTTTEPTGGPQ